jgi:hypothetical protein
MGSHDFFELEFVIGMLVNVLIALVILRSTGMGGWFIGYAVFCVCMGLVMMLVKLDSTPVLGFLYGFFAWPRLAIAVVF